MRVPRGLEQAIAAALADQLEAFVFERQADAIHLALEMPADLHDRRKCVGAC